MVPNTTHGEIANALLLSPLTNAGMSDVAKQAIYDKHHIEETTVTKIRNGKRNITKELLRDYLGLDAQKNVAYHFSAEIVPYIPISKRTDFINDLLDLIERDNGVSLREKTYYKTIADKKEFGVFLAETYIFAITGVSALTRNTVKPKETNLPVKNRFFCGRDTLLKTIWKNYQNGAHVQGLFGMGGIGKTQIALQYAYEHMDEYNVVWWINAENSLTIQNSISKFLILQGIFPEGKNMEISRKIFLDYFDSHDEWFLIYDNVEYGTRHGYNILLSYFPQNVSNGNILITTRCKNAFENAVHLEIPVWNEEDAVTFLEQCSGIKDKENAKNLQKRWGTYLWHWSMQLHILEKLPMWITWHMKQSSINMALKYWTTG